MQILNDLNNPSSPSGTAYSRHSNASSLLVPFTLPAAPDDLHIELMWAKDRASLSTAATNC